MKVKEKNHRLNENQIFWKLKLIKLFDLEW